VRELKGHTYRVSSLCLSNDDKILISGGYDGIVMVWDMMTGICVSGHTGFFNQIVTFSTAIANHRDQIVTDPYQIEDVQMNFLFFHIKS
jgi:WD40 repeat protein